MDNRRQVQCRIERDTYDKIKEAAKLRTMTVPAYLIDRALTAANAELLHASWADMGEKDIPQTSGGYETDILGIIHGVKKNLAAK